MSNLEPYGQVRYTMEQGPLPPVLVGRGGVPRVVVQGGVPGGYMYRA